jgi:hypothetical protein
METMIIQDYDLSLASSRMYEAKDQETEQLQEWGTENKRPGPPDHSNANLDAPGRHKTRDRVSISAQTRMEYAYHKEVSSSTEVSVSSAQAEEKSDALDSRMMTLKRMIEAFTGKEIKLTRVWDTSPDEVADVPENTSSEPAPQQSEAPPEQEWGMRYSYSHSYYESEQTGFSASGTVKTADGREISFSMGLEMSREFYSEENLTITAGAPMVDPLVINYAGNSADLTDVSFEFDLNVDGRTEEVNQPAPGSGFLVFDKNENGKVDDGSELFGPTTGDGFEELAAYDEDKNNWIDENDSIYDKLSLFRRENDVDYLVDLTSANVGAIYLGNQSTSFDLTDPTNTLLGRIRSTGVYLKEDGGVGTVQQIDFTA